MTARTVVKLSETDAERLARFKRIQDGAIADYNRLERELKAEIRQNTVMEGMYITNITFTGDGHAILGWYPLASDGREYTNEEDDE